VTVSVAARVDPDFLTLWSQALDETVASRGGLQIVESIRQGKSDHERATSLVAAQSVWVARNEHAALLGFALCREGLIELLYVDHEHRRQGVARSILAALAASDNPPVDGLALPGDRATKSLYESIGWKARLLTMRGE
jgi:GNAT superfamily N-acetyltransferase